MARTRHTPLSMLERLVSFNTETARSNLPLIDFVEDYLKGWGLDPIRIPNSTGDKAALFVTIGPAGMGGVVLSGHTDVVPVADQAWSSDPFTLRVADGRAYGRGAVDMKGFVATALALVPDFIAAPLAMPIHLFLSYDEEVTCLGVVDGIARMGHDLPMPRMVIVGEPTELEVTDAHKSVVSFRTVITGQEGHSSRPALGASAVMAGGEVVAELVRMQEAMIALGDPSGRFDPPYSTVHAGVISGGTARNILARECRLLWEFRGLPGTSHEAVQAELQAHAERSILPRMRIGAPHASIETICEVAVPHLAPRPGSEAELLALRLAGRNHTTTVSYATEAGHFQNAGIPTVVCGAGSIAQAHQADEFISLADLEAGADFLRRLTRSISV